MERQKQKYQQDMTRKDDQLNQQSEEITRLKQELAQQKKKKVDLQVQVMRRQARQGQGPAGRVRPAKADGQQAPPATREELVNSAHLKCLQDSPLEPTSDVTEDDVREEVQKELDSQIDGSGSREILEKRPEEGSVIESIKPY
eukprot:gene11826-8896_t